jgi:hypothetical protein
VPELSDAIEFTGAALAVIDPVLNHLSPKLNAHHDAPTNDYEDENPMEESGLSKLRH